MNSDTANIPDLIRQLRDDTTNLLREEVNLAKTEAKENVTKAARNAGFLAAGGLVAYSALVLILVGIGFLIRNGFVEQGMNEGMATFLGLLIVGAVVGIIGAILVSKAIGSLKHDNLAPNRTVRSLQEDKQWARKKLS